MDKFEVGELAIVCNVTNPQYACYNGTTCEVLEGLRSRYWKGPDRSVKCYVIRTCDGQIANVTPDSLKKRPGDADPPDTLARGKETPFWRLISAPKRRLLAPT